MEESGRISCRCFVLVQSDPGVSQTGRGGTSTKGKKERFETGGTNGTHCCTKSKRRANQNARAFDICDDDRDHCAIWISRDLLLITVY